MRPVRITHNQSSHGGARVGAGAPEGNDSAKKSPPWLDSYDLDSFDGVDNFTKELLRQTWIGTLGTRQSGNCLAILHLLLERRLWLPGGSDRYNPETHRFNDPWHGRDDEEEDGKHESDSDDAKTELLGSSLAKLSLDTPEGCEQLRETVKRLEASGDLKAEQVRMMNKTIDNALAALRMQNQPGKDEAGPGGE